MNIGRTIFAQVMGHVPLHEFRRCVEQYRGDYKTQRFSSLDQFLCMGIRGAISRSTPALRSHESALPRSPAAAAA